MTSGPQTLLVADIGGTNARFALGRVEAGGAVRLSDPVSYAEGEFEGAEAALRAYLAAVRARPDEAAFAVAGPVRQGAVRLTNRDWAFTEDSIAAASGAGRALLLNDFAAVAMSLPFLPEESLLHLGGPARDPDMWRRDDLRVSALGPGTGLGHAVLLRGDCGLEVLDTEGGHISLAAWDEETWAAVRAIAAKFGRCSLEHVLSGPGLARLHGALGAGWDHGLDARQICDRADEGEPEAMRTVDLFCRMLGAGAGDLALATGARCVFLFGGVTASLPDELRSGGFRERFEAKGAFTDYMRAIPTVLAQSRHAGLIGAAAALVPDARVIVLEES